MSGAPKKVGNFVKDHKTELAIAAAAAATAMTAGAAAPALLGAGAAAGAGAGAAGAAGLTGLTAAEIAASTGAAAAAGEGMGATAGYLGGGLLSQAPATSGIASGILQNVGSMGPEQANLLAAQNEGFGVAGMDKTLQAANPTYNTASKGFQGGMNALNNANKAQKVAGLLNPQQRATMPAPAPPPQAAPVSSNAQIMGGKQQMDPEMLKRLLAMMMGQRNG